jgi:hypothetical protein
MAADATRRLPEEPLSAAQTRKTESEKGKARAASGFDGTRSRFNNSCRAAYATASGIIEMLRIFVHSIHLRGNSGVQTAWFRLAA